MKKHFLLFFMVLFASLAEASAQDTLVTVSAGYSGGSGSPVLHLLGPSDLQLSADGTGTQTVSQQIAWPLDTPVLFSLSATSTVGDLWLSISAASQYTVTIDRIRQNSVHIPVNADGHAVNEQIKVTITRRERAADQEPALGQASAMNFDGGATPVAFPIMSFYLGRAQNGEVLPLLRIPVIKHQSDVDYTVVPDHDDITYLTPSSPTGFHFQTTELDVTMAGLSGVVGSYVLTFAARGGATIATYTFTFPTWSDANGTFLKTAVVQKDLGAGAGDNRYYEARIDAYMTPFGMAISSATHDYHATYYDWHLQGKDAVRVLSVNHTSVTDPTYNASTARTDLFTRASYDAVVIKTRQGSDTGTVVASRQKNYNFFFIGTVDEPGTYAQLPGDTIDGQIGSGAFYLTKNLANPNAPGVRGSISSSGFTSMESSSAFGRESVQTWGDSSPVLNPSSTNEGIPGSGSYASTSVSFSTDPRWLDFNWPTSAETKRSGVVLSRALYAYSETDVHTAADSNDIGLSVVNVTRSDYWKVADDTHVDSITKKFRPDVTVPALRDRVYSQQQPSGAKQSYAYAFGSASATGFTADTVASNRYVNPPASRGADLCVTIISGSATASTATGSTAVDGLGVGASQKIDSLYLQPMRSTKTMEMLHNGAVVRREVHVYTGGAGTLPLFELVSWEAFTYTADGRLSTRTASNNSSYSAVWSGTRKLSETDETGVTTSYTYDQADRVTMVKRESLGTDVPEMVTGFQYDAAGRVIKQWVGPVTLDGNDNATPAATDILATITEYDLGGRVTKRTVPGGSTSAPTLTGSASSPTGIVTQLGYATGNIVRTTLPVDGATTTYSSAGDLDVTETLAGDSSTKTTTRFKDRRVKSISGSAVAVSEAYSYAVVTGGYQQTTVTVASGLRPRVQTFDLLGRLDNEEVDGVILANGTSKPMRTTNTYHSSTGLLQSTDVVQFPSGGTTGIGGTPGTALAGQKWTTYDNFGAVVDSGLNLDKVDGLQATATATTGNPSPDPDRYTTSAAVFEKALDGTWWSVTSTALHYDPAHDYTYTASTKTRRTGFAGNTTSEVWSIGYRGGTAGAVTTFDSATKSRTATSIAVDSTRTVTTSKGGLVTSVQSLDNTASGARTTTNTYDALGRLTKTTDPRSIATAHEYHFGTTQLFRTKSGKNEANTDITAGVFGYDSRGRVTTVLDAKGETSTTTFNTAGQVTDRGGTAVKPVHYVYDGLGQQTQFWTYRSTGTADITKWEYDANTGWITAKEDAAGKRVTYGYEYAAPFKIVTITSPRGGLTTKKSYLLTTGELATVNYSDATTDVEYTYTRTGQVQRVKEGSITNATVYPATFATGSRERAFTYNYEQEIMEMLDDTWYGGLALSSTYDETGVKGRSMGYTLGTAANRTQEFEVAYSYDGFGRIGGLDARYSAQSGNGQNREAWSTSFSYDYVTGTDTWQTLTQRFYTETRALEANRDALKSITAKWNGGTTLAEYVYTTNDAGERTHQMQRGTFFADYDTASNGATVSTYEYSPEGELTQAKAAMGTITGAIVTTGTVLPGRTYGYNYDKAGNRVTVKVGTDNLTDSGTDSVSYTGTGGQAANNLNQVMSRGTLHGHISGTANESATVQVAGVAANKPTNLRYWDAILADLGKYSSYTITATRGGTTSPGLPVWATVRPPSESFTYDEEGNLTGDAQWTYQYDAENRLVRQTTRNSSGLDAAGWTLHPPARDITYSYDYLGRRVEKISYKDGVPTFSRRFVYDGWNLIAEIEVNASVAKVRRSYVWGLDLVSSLTKSGGVGGLVLETLHTDNSLTGYSVAYDGNGNVAALVDENGAAAATYEYDPFGQSLRSEGAQSTESTASPDQPGDNPFRFSTKYFERETGLVYYGHRFYDPSLGRFINRDPKGEDGGANLYGFVGNRPVSHWDYLGLTEESEDAHPGNLEAAQKEAAFRLYQRLDEEAHDAFQKGDISAYLRLRRGADNAARVLGVDPESPRGGFGYTELRDARVPETASESFNREMRAASSEAKRWTEETFRDVSEKPKPEAGKAPSNLAVNAANGAAWEKHVEQVELPKTQTEIQRQITIRPNGTTAGNVRLDNVGKDKETGSIKLTDSKASETAPLTKNQRPGYEAIEKNGGTVVGEGKAPYVGGTKIPPTKVDIIRRRSVGETPDN